MLDTRDPLEWHFKPLDHSVGLSFRCVYVFAYFCVCVSVCGEFVIVSVCLHRSLSVMQSLVYILLKHINILSISPGCK